MSSQVNCISISFNTTEIVSKQLHRDKQKSSSIIICKMIIEI